MSMIPSEILSGRKVYWKYHAQPHIRYKICSTRVGWITPKGSSPQFTGEGSGVLVRLQTRVNGEWLDYLHNDVISMLELYPNFRKFEELSTPSRTC